MQRLQYYISFTLLYLCFSLALVWISSPKIRFVINGAYNEERRNKIHYFFVAACLIIISSIRMNTGSDYWSYSLIYNRILSNYQSIHDILADRPFSPGIHIISYILKTISRNFELSGVLEQNLLMIAVSVFTTLLTLRIIDRHSNDVKFSLLVYLLMGYYCIANNILKQQVAMSFLFVAYYRCREKKYALYVLYCTLACLFHITAIVPSLLYPVILKYRTRKIDIYVLIGLCLLITAILPFTSRFFANASFLGYTKYFENFATYSKARIGSIYAFGCLVTYMFIFAVMYKQKEVILEMSPDSYAYIFAIAIGIIFNALALNFWLLVRISLYFYQFIIILLPNAVIACKPTKKIKRLIYLGLVVFCVFYVLYSWDNHYFGYHTVFNNNMVPAYLDTYISMYE